MITEHPAPTPVESPSHYSRYGKSRYNRDGRTDHRQDVRNRDLPGIRQSPLKESEPWYLDPTKETGQSPLERYREQNQEITNQLLQAGSPLGVGDPANLLKSPQTPQGTLGIGWSDTNPLGFSLSPVVPPTGKSDLQIPFSPDGGTHSIASSLPMESGLGGGASLHLDPPRKLPERDPLASQKLNASERGVPRNQSQRLGTIKGSQTVSSQLSSQNKEITKKVSQDKQKPAEDTKTATTGKKRKLPTTTILDQGTISLTTPSLSSQRKSVPSGASGRLSSQSLSSFGQSLPSQSTGRSQNLASVGRGAVAQPAVEKPLSKRFHGGNPGEPARPDYTYQYQGPRRYSVGESEYGTGSGYEALPYYRRRR